MGRLTFALRLLMGLDDTKLILPRVVATMLLLSRCVDDDLIDEGDIASDDD
jgi:hypothetical protein